MLAPTDGTASGHEGCKKPKGIPINESAPRDAEAGGYHRVSFARGRRARRTGIGIKRFTLECTFFANFAQPSRHFTATVRCKGSATIALAAH